MALLDNMVTTGARRVRYESMLQLLRLLEEGTDLLLLCHCRRHGEAPTAWNRCHGDGIRRTLLRWASHGAPPPMTQPEPVDGMPVRWQDDAREGARVQTNGARKRRRAAQATGNQRHKRQREDRAARG